MPDGKTCTGCREMKPLSAYTKHSSGRLGLRARCKECRGAEGSALYRERREERLAYSAQRWQRLRALAVAVYGGSCASCSATEGLVFDHVEGGGQAHRRVESDSVYIRRIAVSGKPDPRLQLLCGPCHKPKTAREMAAENRRRAKTA